MEKIKGQKKRKRHIIKKKEKEKGCRNIREVSYFIKFYLRFQQGMRDIRGGNFKQQKIK